MKILIKEATIIDPHSKHHQSTKDILIENGLIINIGKSIESDNAHVFEAQNLHISKGWTDINARFGDPGMEHKEDITSGLNSAASGGFTQVCIMPSTEPCIQSKASISYLLNESSDHLVSLHPIGALTENRRGEQINELYDMYQSGAIGFSDDKSSIANASVMKIALLYAKNFDGLIFSFSAEEKTAFKGQMNEGATSTRIGLKGIPALAEELQIMRDIQLCEYTNSKIHFSTVSTAGSVELIRQAKKKGLNVTADVSSLHLLLDDSLLENFNSNLKLNPPLRGQKDIKALKQGLKDGTIDAICSNHNPQNIENKQCEFDIASFGSINLETTFGAANKALKDTFSLDEIITLITSKPREILGINNHVIEKGNLADLTLFDPTIEWNYSSDKIVSKSSNSALLNTNLTGRSLGIINDGQLDINND